MNAKYTFAAIFVPDGTGYSVHFPQLDGCYAQGGGFSNAHDMAQEALALHLHGMVQDGLEIPKPDFEVKTKPGELIVLVTTWMVQFPDMLDNRMVEKTVTLPAWLNEAGEKAGVNFSLLLQHALMDSLGIPRPRE